MFYNKKLLIACALIMMALPSTFIGMKKEGQEQASDEMQLFKNIDYALLNRPYLERLEKILDHNPALVNVLMSIPKYGVVSPLEYTANGLGSHAQDRVLDIMRLLMARGAAISPLVIEKINKQIDGLSDSTLDLEDTIKNAKYEIVAKIAESSLVEVKSFLKSLQEFKSYLAEKMQEQQKQEWQQQMQAPRIIHLQTTQPKTQSIEYLKSLERMGMKKEAEQEKMSDESQLFKIIDNVSYDDSYTKDLKKILDHNPALVNVSMMIPKYGVISPLEYAASHLKIYEYGIQERVLNIMSLLLEKGAKISSSVIEGINNGISSLTNNVANIERRINQLVKLEENSTEMAKFLKIDRNNLIDLKSILASLQEFKSYLKEKMQKQKIEEARILDWQKAHPETSSIEYLESLKRK